MLRIKELHMPRRANHIYIKTASVFLRQINSLSSVKRVRSLTKFIFLQLILQTTPREKPFGIQRRPLPLEPSVLLREANRRRASLSAGSMSEMFDGRPSNIDG